MSHAKFASCHRSWATASLHVVHLRLWISLQCQISAELFCCLCLLSHIINLHFPALPPCELQLSTDEKNGGNRDDWNTVPMPSPSLPAVQTGERKHPVKHASQAWKPIGQCVGSTILVTDVAIVTWLRGMSKKGSQRALW